MLDDQNRGCEGHMLTVEDSPINLSLILSSKDDRPYDGDYSPEFATTEDTDRPQHLIDMAQAQRHKSLRQRQQQGQTKASKSQ
ncbi:MAG: hypothetical protein ACI8VY_000342 [Cellvibrionaceae bacterium]|jgi:hypothetical protein